VATLFHERLVLTTAVVPGILAAVIPSEAQAARVEMYMQSYSRNADGAWASEPPE
jgi:hypothetical protein